MNTFIESNRSGQSNPVYDVIISGAGPVGLFLACELALAKCNVLILEKALIPQTPLKQLPFGIRGLSAPSIEALYRRGLLQELEIHKSLKNPHSTRALIQGTKPQRQGGHFAGIAFYESNVDTSKWIYRLPGSTETNLISEMQELETVLARRAQSFGVVINRGMPITDFHETADDVSVQSGDHSFRGKWLVGCDGSRSFVRKTGGFEFAGTEPEFTGYSTNVDIADPEKLRPGRNLTPTGMYFQSQPGYLLMLEFDGGAGRTAGSVTIEQVQKVLRRVSNTDVTISALHTATTWTDRARQSTSYRKGRVLLAGDAAHIHSPLGGQGLNLGLGDAMNLGWKLAATIKDKAPAGLLDTYFTERYPVGEKVLDWSRAQVAIMAPSAKSRALNAIMRDLINTKDGATYIAGRIWGVHTNYDLGGGHPLVGNSVPNFELEDGTRIGELMRDGEGMLLDFSMNTSLKNLTGKYGDTIKYVSGHAKEQFGLTAALIRPDGIIAWATDNQNDTNEFHFAAEKWFASVDSD